MIEGRESILRRATVVAPLYCPATRIAAHTQHCGERLAYRVDVAAQPYAVTSGAQAAHSLAWLFRPSSVLMQPTAVDLAQRARALQSDLDTQLAPTRHEETLDHPHTSLASLAKLRPRSDTPPTPTSER